MKPYYDNQGVKIFLGKCEEALTNLPSESVQCVVTSPPYWGLRDYGIERSVWEGKEDCTHQWGNKISVNSTNHTDKRRWNHTRNGRDEEQPPEKRVAWLRTTVDQGNICELCGAWRGCLGLEPTPELYVEHMVSVFREVWRVLRADGTLWLNIGDNYASKNLVGIPWMLAFALRSAGWYLRSDIIWHKSNAMPESVTDRPTKSHEYLFLLSKMERYFYDADIIKESAEGWRGSRFEDGKNAIIHPNVGKNRPSVKRGGFNGKTEALAREGRNAFRAVEEYRNKRSVWTIPTSPYSGAHFATFPEKLVEPCIKAGCPEGGTVLDPFAGSGTVLAVARRLGLKAIGIELKPEYCRMIEERLSQEVLQFQQG